MPVNPNRFGQGYEQETGIPPERLPGDPGGEIDWVCQNCDTAQHGRPELGCGTCGAGRPGAKAEKPQPTYEELNAVNQGAVEARREGAHAGFKAGLGLAEHMLATTRPQVPPPAFDALRQIIREELRAVLSPMPAFTEPEKTAVLEGLAFIQQFLAAGHVPAEMAEKIPDADGLAALSKKIEGA